MSPIRQKIFDELISGKPANQIITDLKHPAKRKIIEKFLSNAVYSFICHWWSIWRSCFCKSYYYKKWITDDVYFTIRTEVSEAGFYYFDGKNIKDIKDNEIFWKVSADCMRWIKNVYICISKDPKVPDYEVKNVRDMIIF